MNGPVWAVDVGGSSVKLGVVVDGRVVRRDSLAARPAEGLAKTLEQVGNRLRELTCDLGMDRSTVQGIGIGLPCIVDCRRADVISAPAGKYDDAPSINLPSWASRSLELPVRADNDAHLALLGEWAYGAGRGVNDLVMVTLGTGVGCSVLIGGRPLRGRHYQAGLLGGFTVIRSGGRPWSESAAGSVEAETGSWALPAIAQESPDFGASSLASHQPITYEVVFRLAEQGDPLALRLRNRSLDLWSDFVINLIHLFDPERVVLGGAILRSAAAVIPWIQRRVDADAWTPSGKVAIAAAEFPEDAGLLGAEVSFVRELSYL